MRLDRRLRQHQPLRDLGVGEAARDQQQHLALARGQLLEPFALSRVEAVVAALVARRRQPVRVGVEQPARDARGDHRVAAGDRPDRGQQVGRLRVLEQEAAGAGAQRRVDVLVEVEGREDDDPGVAAGGDDPARGLDAVELGHAHVHQRHVRPQRLRLGDRLEPVGGLAGDVQVGLTLDHHAERHPHQLLVVDQQDRRAHRTASSRRATGCVSVCRRRCTRQPPSSVGPTSSVAVIDVGALAHAAQAAAVQAAAVQIGVRRARRYRRRFSRTGAAGVGHVQLDLAAAQRSCRCAVVGRAACLSVLVSASWATRKTAS